MSQHQQVPGFEEGVRKANDCPRIHEEKPHVLCLSNVLNLIIFYLFYIITFLKPYYKYKLCKGASLLIP